ncbi:MAG: ABC transporter ATP-binding protein [Acidaminococcaceae bacterium]|nr:ABC transporter ATP-binding protein [Acidaminococcaceae bacterium]
MDIIVKDLSVSFSLPGKKVKVLKHIDVRFPQGMITAVIGESGSGKSVLGTSVVGLLEKNAEFCGEVFHGERDLLKADEKEKNFARGRVISWIAQNPPAALSPLLRTGELLSEIFFYRGCKTPNAVKAACMSHLRKFGFEDPERVYEKYPCELSGGMAQRVLASMMTVEKPEWIIADEPTKGLDPLVRKEVAEMFLQMKSEQSTGIILITHDLRLAEKISDHTVVMYAGEIMESGLTREVFAAPRHPYTEALLKAQPDRGMKPIKGGEYHIAGSGCAFGKRCDCYDGLHCAEQQVMCIKREHFVKCWRETRSDDFDSEKSE